MLKSKTLTFKLSGVFFEMHGRRYLQKSQGESKYCNKLVYCFSMCSPFNNSFMPFSIFPQYFLDRKELFRSLINCFENGERLKNKRATHK